MESETQLFAKMTAAQQRAYLDYIKARAAYETKQALKKEEKKS